MKPFKIQVRMKATKDTKGAVMFTEVYGDDSPRAGTVVLSPTDGKIGQQYIRKIALPVEGILVQEQGEGATEIWVSVTSYDPSDPPMEEANGKASHVPQAGRPRAQASAAS